LERPASEFVARFIGSHNVLQWKNGRIAVRADRCTLGPWPDAHASASGGSWNIKGRWCAWR
jgi:hypothetical protein